MKSKLFILLFIFSFFTSCKKQENQQREIEVTQNLKKTSIQVQIEKSKYPYQDSLFEKHPELIVNSFDFPVGKPDAKGYYNALKFTKNGHLGDDWNGIGGGNSDLGDPIYSIANGYVSFAENIGGGWGNVIRIIHKYKGAYYESLYAHCQTINVIEGDLIKKGEPIATIGNADGIYLAHLHLEIRDDIFMDIGGGYAENTTGYLNPTTFIKEN